MSLARKSVALAFIAAACLPVSTQADVLLPKHTVLAFNLKECPNGWKPYAPAAGAFAVGVGGNFALGSGGAPSMDKWVLTPTQIPTLSGQINLGQLPLSAGAEDAKSAYSAVMTQARPDLQDNPFPAPVKVGTDNPQPLPMPKVAGLLYCENQ